MAARTGKIKVEIDGRQVEATLAEVRDRLALKGPRYLVVCDSCGHFHGIANEEATAAIDDDGIACSCGGTHLPLIDFPLYAAAEIAGLVHPDQVASSKPEG